MAKREMLPVVAKVSLNPHWTTISLFDGDKFKGRMWVEKSKKLPTPDQVRKIFKEGYLYDLGEVIVEVDNEQR